MTSDLAARQAALVAALVAVGDPPPGFDQAKLRVAAAALLRKRAGVVAGAWPLLAAGCDDWPAGFVAWAHGRVPEGGLRDGWDYARHLRTSGGLPDLAAIELATREALLRYDGVHPPCPRRLPAVRRVGRTVVLGVSGRAYPLIRG
ncbi:MAG: hypothetical protein ACRDT4_18840 [Micromonosporaceae bacterium]